MVVPVDVDQNNMTKAVRVYSTCGLWLTSLQEIQAVCKSEGIAVTKSDSKVQMLATLNSVRGERASNMQLVNERGIKALALTQVLRTQREIARGMRRRTQQRHERAQQTGAWCQYQRASTHVRWQMCSS